MPYTRLIIKAVNADNLSELLYELDLEKQGNSWNSNLNKVYVNPYAEGVIAYGKGEVVEEDSDLPELSSADSDSESQTEASDDQSEAEEVGEVSTESAILETEPTEEQLTEEVNTEGGSIEETGKSTESTKDFTIQFRQIPWYISKAEAEEKLLSEGSSVVGSLGAPNQMDDLRSAFILDYTLQDKENMVDGAGCRGWYNEMEVAGYTPTFVWAYYLYPIKDGVMEKIDEEAEFYFAYYEFQTEAFSDYEAIFNDLGGKLKYLYDEPVEQESDLFKILTWTDKDDNKIVLSKLKGDNENVKLAYIAGGAEQKLQEAKKIIDADALDAENAAREENADNVNGL